jgi:hypothetical protein
LPWLALNTWAELRNFPGCAAGEDGLLFAVDGILPEKITTTADSRIVVALRHDSTAYRRATIRRFRLGLAFTESKRLCHESSSYCVMVSVTGALATVPTDTTTGCGPRATVWGT